MRRGRRLPLEELAPYLFEVPATPGFVDWTAIFGNDRPLEVEVGFGKGLFLIGAARARPQLNFVGIEIARKYQLFTATRLAKRGLHNVRLVKADARFFLRDHMAAASCRAVHVYFPDPWWKKRHLKRRVFTPEFVTECERVLSPCGLLYVVTDVADYFDLIKGLCGERPGLVPAPAPAESTASHDLDYLTNFERKFRKQGSSIYRATYAKTDPMDPHTSPTR